MSRLTARLLAMTCALLMTLQAGASEPIHIGVLAFRPKPQTIEQWHPLAVALKKTIPGHDFVIEAYTYPELDEAVAGKHLDFVLTNPGHYVALAKKLGLTAPLATLAINDRGHTSTSFGGVIFRRADSATLKDLKDLEGITIAATSTASLGGYQMQAYELSRAGIQILRDNTLITTGMPHDNVVHAVLSGQADAGFVRTGVLEGMVQEGKLDLSAIHVINQQQTVKFPLMLSTALYPEWPFASLPSTDENIARKVAAALFNLEENAEETRAMGIHGFVVPADYTPVADLLKELRIAPFNQAPSFDIRDVWHQYLWQLVTGLFAGGLILLLSFYLVLNKRRLNHEHHELMRQQKMLLQSEQHLQAVIMNEPECIKMVDANGGLVQMNPAGLAMIEADSLEQVAGLPVTDVIAPEYREAFLDMHKRVIAGEAQQMEFEVLGLKGGRRWMETHAVPMRENGETVHLAVTRDITERKKMEQSIRQLAFYDSLTNLPNRRLLDDRFHQTMAINKRTGSHSALLFLDLDNFKPLNDTHGHNIGDLLLREVAGRLRKCVREIDSVARFGGDEFVLLLSDLSKDTETATSQARSIAEKVLASLSKPYVLPVAQTLHPDSVIEHHCTASIGVVVFSGDDDDPANIIKQGDVAMYRAKEAGRNQIHFHNEVK